MQYEDQAEFKLENNKPIILQKLKELNIDIVKAQYSGDSDNGSIDFIKPIYNKKVNQKKDLEEYSIQVKVIYSNFNRDTSEWELIIQDKTVSLYKAIEDLLYDIIASKFSGWENNTGGYGFFEFNVKEEAINWKHIEYHLEEKSYSYVY